MQFGACPTSSVAVRNPGGKMSACFSPPGVCMAIFLRFSWVSCMTGYAKEGVLVVRCGPEKSFFFTSYIRQNFQQKCKVQTSQLVLIMTYTVS